MAFVNWLRAASCGLLLAASQLAQEPAVEYEETLVDAQRKLLHGDWLGARAAFEQLADFLVEDGAAGVEHFQVAIEVGLASIELGRGNYEMALRAMDALPPGLAGSRNVDLVRAAALRRVGRHAEAGQVLQRLVDLDANDFEARHLLGEVLWDDGRRGEARARWQHNATLPEPENGVALAFRAASLFRLGGRGNLEAASGACVRSLSLAPDRPEARVTLGLLKFAVYGEAAGFPSGEQDLRKVLDEFGEYEPALLAMYRIRSANMVLEADKTEEFLQRVLERNPRSVEALTIRASNVLDDRRFEVAAGMLDEVLAIDPNCRPTLCHRAAASFLLHDEDGYEHFRQRALAGDPGWPDVDRVLGDHLVALYRFADAMPFYRAAEQSDPTDVATLEGMGKALVYIGEGEEARRVLERCKQLEPGYVDPWRNNVIAVQKLLEEQYVTVTGDGVELRLHRDDREVLQAYLLPFQIEAIEVLDAKYGIEPSGPTRIEVLHTWDDFSVRTIGFRGFTALGACFGRLITLVSPVDGDLRRQDFMWEATAWHEYTHVLTLGLSRHRVPRWLTEGFSVYEERARDPSWERGMQRELFDAFHNQDIPPIALLNRLFRGPRILFGYYQGGLIVEKIAKDHGFERALELLRAFGEDYGLEAAFQRAIGKSSHAFDLELLQWIERDLLRGMKLVPLWDGRSVARFEAAARRNPDDVDARLQLAWAALQRDSPVDVGRWLAEVLRRAPDNAAAALVRAELLRRRKDLEGAVALWRQGFAGGEDDFDSRIHCGDVLLELGDVDGAIEMFQRAKRCWPTCTEQATSPELRLARIYRERGDRVQELMETKAYCRRTARAFAPRWRIAEYDRETGNRAEELRLLRECNRIDPFDRELHRRMGDACEALGDLVRAALEFEVAAAVAPAQDRRGLARDAELPASDSPEDRAERGELWLRAARLRHQAGDHERANELLNRVRAEASDSGAAEQAERLQREWRGR